MKNFKYLPVIVGAVIFFSAGTAFAAVNDYSNYFTFDEGTGRTVGDAKGGQNGVLTGTSTGFGWASGMVGTALGMDGMSGESVVLPDGFLKGTQGSIAAWIKMNSLSSRNIIFSGRSTGDNYIYAAFMVDYEGRPLLAFRTTTDGNDRKAQGAKTLNKNEWYQLVLIATGGTYRMFINGEEVSVAGDNIGKWFSDITDRTFMYRIGSLDSNPLSGVFDGYFDDLRIYARVLTQEDVTTLYNGGRPGTPGLPLAAQPATPPTQVTIVDLISATTTVTNAVPAPTTVATEVAPVSQTGTTEALASPNADAARKAKIQELIDRILLLIAELQKQLAILKGQN